MVPSTRFLNEVKEIPGDLENYVLKPLFSFAGQGVVIVTFLLTRALPGDPAAYFAGPAATTEAIQQIRVKLGLV